MTSNGRVRALFGTFQNGLRIGRGIPKGAKTMSDTPSTPSLDNMIAAQANDPEFVAQNFGTLVLWYERPHPTPMPTLKSLIETET